jgi:Nif-specific regulatory protein
MERIAYLSTADKIDADELTFVLSPPSRAPSPLEADLPLAEATRQFQIACIQRQIDQCRGNMTEAAERLGLHRSNLYRKMNQLGMGGGDESSG